MSCDSGAQAEGLMPLARELHNQQEVEEIVTHKDWTPQEARDFKAEPATQTTCAILHTILSQEDPNPTSETIPHPPPNQSRLCFYLGGGPGGGLTIRGEPRSEAARLQGC